jgi:hypothetical protein
LNPVNIRGPEEVYGFRFREDFEAVTGDVAPVLFGFFTVFLPQFP